MNDQTKDLRLEIQYLKEQIHALTGRNKQLEAEFRTGRKLDEAEMTTKGLVEKIHEYFYEYGTIQARMLNEWICIAIGSGVNSELYKRNEAVRMLELITFLLDIKEDVDYIQSEKQESQGNRHSIFFNPQTDISNGK
jgi:hypothetical protein